MKKLLFINYIQGKDIILFSYRHSFNGVQRHFQQYFTYIVAASFIGMGLGINYVILANHLGTTILLEGGGLCFFFLKKYFDSQCC
jgi:hypothetical protein